MIQKYDQGSSEAHTQPRRSCHTPGKDNVPDNLAVDGARDAVLQLQVHLGYGVLREDGGIRDVTYCNCKRLSKADLDERNIRIAADSTMLRMVNRLMALSLGVHREQLLHRMGLTWPRPFLFRPLEGC